MQLPPTARPSNAGSTGASASPPRTAAVTRSWPGGKRRRVLGSIGAVLAIGALAAGCGGGTTASGANSTRQLLSSARQETGSTTTSTTALPSCGSNRDPFDPTGSPPPAGSPAVC